MMKTQENKMTEFENKIKADARANSRDWLGKQNMSEDVISALFTPMLKYPKDANGEPDKSRTPTLKVKLASLWVLKFMLIRFM